MKRLLSVFFVAVFQLNYAQLPNYIPTSNLVGFWPFSNNANDVSGNNNTGTVSNASLTTDRFSNAASAYLFNGNSSYISTSLTGVLGNNARAVAFWAKSTNSVSTMSGVSWGDETTTPGIRYECGFNQNASGVAIIGCNSAVNYSAPQNVGDNNWHHYVYQFAGGGSGQLSQVQVYQDEVLLTNINYSYQASAVLNTASTWPVNFGRIPYSIPHYFSGSLDDIAIWTRTLTPCEIHELYTSAKTNITVSASSSSLCAGQSAVLTATGVNTYTWSTSANSASISVSPTVTTVYSVNGTGPAGCTASKSFTVTVVNCTGINEAEQELQSVSVYPNPNNGAFTIKGCAGTPVKVTNALGQLVTERTLSAQGAAEINDLPAGLYFISDAVGKASKKFIVIK